MKRLFVFTSLLFCSLITFAQQAKQVYELRTYELRYGGSRAVLENYFKNALFPTLNKYGIQNIGAFDEISKEDPAKIYILIPYDSMESFASTIEKIEKDADFKALSTDYDQLTADKAPFARYSSSLMLAFDGFPKIQKLTPSQKLLEVRIYESHNESAAANKRSMFNDEELKIFEETNLHSIFFGQNIVGNYLPCLTYMLAFDTMEERDANWKAFVNHPDWKRISTDPKYAGNMNKIRRFFLNPLPFSQL